MSNKREKTKQRIKDAYIELLKSKSPLQISVSDIASECHINRSTFYEYFSYIDLLIEEIISDQLTIISVDNDKLLDIYHTQNNYTNPENIKLYFKTFDQNKVLNRFIKSKESDYFKSMIVRIQSSREIHKYNIADDAHKLRIMYRNSGVFAILFRWVEAKREYDLDELSKVLFDIVKSNNF